MKRLMLILTLLGVSLLANAAETRYELCVDGLACPYCAYGIEKKIKALDGVDKSSIEIKLNEGLVAFQADTRAPITAESLKTLINDAGFTLRQYQAQPLSQKNQ